MGILDDRVLRRNTAMKEMLDLSRGIVSDGVVSEAEARRFQTWIDENPDMLGVWPVSELVGIIQKVLDDGRVSAAEQSELMSLLERVSGR